MGDQMQAHKLILSACSPFFRTILRRNRHEHPLLYLKGVKYADLVSVLNFMYHGEVNVAQEELNSFLAVAEDLKVKGLTQSSGDTKKQSSFRPEPPKPRARDPAPTSVRSEAVTVPPPPPKRPRPAPPSVSRPVPGSYIQEDIQEVVPVKSEPDPLPQESQQIHMARVEPVYEEVRTGVVADPNMEYEEEYADYGDYEEGGENYDTSGMALDGQDGNKELDQLLANALTRDPVSGEWMCNHCSKTNKDKARITRHAET